MTYNPSFLKNVPTITASAHLASCRTVSGCAPEPTKTGSFVASFTPEN